MIRALHRWPGLLALLLVTVLGVSGAALSIFPATEQIASPQADRGLNVAELASRVHTAYPDVTQIRRAPSGRITAYWFDESGAGSAVVDPATGQGSVSADPNPVETWLVDLHRSLFLGDNGRIAAAAGALAMLILAVSGAFMVARRTGGWRAWFSPLRGPLSQRLHVEIARLSVFGLAFSAATALWMTASTFGYLPDAAAEPDFPAQVSGEVSTSISELGGLANVPVSELRSLRFPYPGDPTDVFTLTTDKGTGYIDQGTGETLAWSDLSLFGQVSETIYMLHTGRGAALVGLVLGLMALGVPVMGVTGAVIWLVRQRNRPRIRGNRPAGQAETIVLVGSEGGTTWGFAATLHAALAQAGQRVHVAPMSSFAPSRYEKARRILVLAATYGSGDAPDTAKGFIARLEAEPAPSGTRIAVLGFGDKSFPDYCGFGRHVAELAMARGWEMLLPFDSVDRQSPQDFARWGDALGEVLGHELTLDHQPVLPRVETLTLISRRDYGAEVQAPTAILRFALPRASLIRRLTGTGFTRFHAGDLIGIVPEGSTVPRFYSLASNRGDGFIEIAVRRHPGGLCSHQLTGLEPGQTVRAFLRPNPAFRPARSGAGTILIGAGTGIAPLAGFVRNNARRAPIHLFFGLRHPDSDFLFDRELSDWQRDGRLTRLATAVSRGARPHYVQDALRDEAESVARLVQQGAKVMVCGGRDMARGIAEALDDILAPAGLATSILKAEGRYVEDVY